MQEVWNDAGFTAETKIFSDVKGKYPTEGSIFDYGCYVFFGTMIQVNRSLQTMFEREVMVEWGRLLKS